MWEIENAKINISVSSLITLTRTLSKQVDGEEDGTDGEAMLTGRGTAAERELRKHD